MADATSVPFMESSGTNLSSVDNNLDVIEGGKLAGFSGATKVESGV
jgi:hypothetical protein